MSEPFDIEAYCDLVAAAMGFELTPEWRQSLIDNFKATHAVAESVLSFPLDDTVEPAPVFEP
jgi:hypothetical protein